MPIYEYYCADCHRVFRFLSRRVAPGRRPPCPRCGRERLERRPSTFAVSRGAAEPGGDPDLDVDPARLERAMASFSDEAGSLSPDDPRRAAAAVRRFYDHAGLPLGSSLEEALDRLESGEDPDSVEADLGDVPEVDQPRAGPRIGRRRRSAPPTVDPELHEL